MSGGDSLVCRAGRCAGCHGEAIVERGLYDRSWCAECAAAIRFEERLAKGEGLVVVDVIADDRGLHMAFSTPEGTCSESEFVDRFSGLAITKLDIKDELAFAAVQLVAEVGQLGSCLFIRRGAARAAQRFGELASEYLPLLDADERKPFEALVETARWIEQQAAPTAPN